ncbi:hypothetical protein [Virgibacillus necropolis]|uniref:Lipoprotein n=1 Tax=Virgibacillus necropolis TaxID=163877 RepID=A0A221MGK5_9BACI|nr:hypothetical protein [Virgibacillus necropolis]ASN06760.1 hypothetical protein CFK40_17915 [Virgibacillus necropolis]
MYFIQKIISVILILVMLSACSNEEKVLEIKDKSFAETLLINKVVDNVSGSSGEPIVIKEDQRIIKLLTMVEGMNVKKGDYDKFINKLRIRDSYSFSISDEEKLTTGTYVAYSFYVLEDGTFFFIQNTGDAIKRYITTKKYPDMLNKIKETLEIDF